MKFLLVLAMGYPDSAPAIQTVGVMIDQDTCSVAGAGMTMLLERANPGLDVAWTCLPADKGVGA